MSLLCSPAKRRHMGLFPGLPNCPSLKCDLPFQGPAGPYVRQRHWTLFLRPMGSGSKCIWVDSVQPEPKAGLMKDIFVSSVRLCSPSIIHLHYLYVNTTFFCLKASRTSQHQLATHPRAIES